MDNKKTRTSKVKIKYRRSEVISGYLFILPSLIIFVTFMIIPIFMGLYISLTDYDGFKTMNFIGLKNYADMFKDSYFQVSFKNNILYTLFTVPGTLILSLLLAVAVNKGIKGSPVFKTVFFFPYITSMVAVGIIWTLLFNPTVGPINSFLKSVGISNPPGWLLSTKSALPAVMIVTIWKWAGYYMIIFLAGLQGIPKQLYEASEVDGASGITRFFHITLPLLSPTTFLILILLIINSFQVFDLINIMTEGGPGRATNVLVYRIYQEGFKYMHFGYASAEAYFLFAIILIITGIQFWGQKKWVVY
ncbi:MAG: sugar ABC transporter permease [Butyrivibrio sp.]|jgi:multiple sugar transport system permease protein|nr:sugar ABC transporter permease [Butyrivibrio sp.]